MVQAACCYGAVNPAGSSLASAEVDRCHGFLVTIKNVHMARATNKSVHPSATVGSPTYLSPEASTANPMIGRMIPSGARDENKEPTMTAGIAPISIDVVTETST
jgi:hypothetical protein